MRPSLLRRRGWRVTIQKSLLCFAALIGRFRRLLPSGLAGWVLAGAHPALIWCVFNQRIPFSACRFRLSPSAIVTIPTPEVVASGDFSIGHGTDDQATTRRWEHKIWDRSPFPDTACCVGEVYRPT